MPAPTTTTAKFGGKALPGTAALQSWVDFVNGGSWSPLDFQIGDSMPALGLGHLTWRGRGVWQATDFGERTVILPMLYKETAASLASALGTLSQAGEQYLTFDTGTYLSVRYAGFASRTLRRKFAPLWWKGNLVFKAAEPWAKDFQPSGSLANLLNPNGGFETSGATVTLFNSIGSSGDGTLNAWAFDSGVPTIASNVVTMPAGAQMHAGSADATDGTFTARFTFATNSQPCALVHVAASNSWIRARVDGTTLYLDKMVAGVATNGVNTVAAALVNATSYWLRVVASGTTYTITVYADAAGALGASIASTSGTIADAAIQSGAIGLATSVSSSAGCTFGGAFANVCQLTGDGKGWTPVVVSGEPAFAASKVSPQGGLLSGTVYNKASGANGYWSYSFNAAAATYSYRGFLKASGAGVASLNLGGAGLQSVTQDGTWRQTTDASLALSAGATTVRCQLNGAGTAYFDNLTLQQSFDSVTGLYSQAFIDQVALGGSAGAGTTTTFTVTYAGSVWAEPLWRITLPSTKGAAISSVTIVNQTTGVGLTFNFSTPLAAGSAQTLDIDCAVLTGVIGTTQYDWAPPGGAKTGFPVLFPGTNQMAVTIVTSSGTATGCTADSSFVNRWEV